MSTELKFWRNPDDDCWYFQHPEPGEEPMGPYDTKSEMLDDKRGIERTVSSEKWQQLSR